ncbi:hypothetical protein H633G_00884 [Metarhizium anisopliae BRIP 53284]|nr:hypothetical protein H633G_00884 [Metarhizium anisopliae BRIP 53284]
MSEAACQPQGPWMKIASGSPFKWVDPPREYVERQSNALKAACPSPSCDIADEEYRQFVDLPEDVLEDQDHFHQCINDVGCTVNFHSVEVNGVAGLFLRDDAQVEVPTFTLPQLIAMLRSGTLDAGFLRNYLKGIPESGIMDYSTSFAGECRLSVLFFKSLTAVCAVSDSYSDLAGAAICISITKKPIGHAHWVSKICDPTEIGGKTSWRATKYSCLAMLESGGHGNGDWNSIFASEVLLQDPILQDNSGERAFKGIRRIHGNLGYPGTVLLIPPPTPRVLQIDPTRGRFVQAATFDGKPGNSFTQTSLHLKFTDYKFPLASAPGAVAADVVMHEALISLYDGTRWIADLDII